jgi:hypothetical protein
MKTTGGSPTRRSARSISRWSTKNLQQHQAKNTKANNTKNKNSPTSSNASNKTQPKNKAKTTNSNTKKKATTQWKYSKVKEMMRQELWDKSSDIHKWSAKKVASEFKNELKELGDYKFDRFNKNFEALKQKVYNEGLMVEKELEDFEYQKKKFPSTGTSKQGHPLWHKHAAKHLLTKDVEDGLHHQYSPSQLRKMRYEYQEFPLSTFRKHIYQEKTKQHSEPYWVVKRNKKARRQHEKAAEEMRKAWHVRKGRVV